MKDIIIKTVPVITTSKGETIEWCKGLPGKQVSIYHRAKGTHFASHYHTGEDPSKNPERFFLISGKIRVRYKQLDSKSEKEKIILAGQEMLIYPYIWHEAEALENSVFLEYRETVFDKNNSDTITSLEK